MTKELRFKAEKASLLLSLVMNGVKYTGGSLREVSMGTSACGDTTTID